jgi:hypothetical protein
MPSSSADLVDLIRSKIHNGRLPGAASARLFAGHGDGHSCACCEKAVRRGDLGYEIECQTADGQAACNMHMQCYQLWVGVLRSIELEARPTLPAPQHRSSISIPNRSVRSLTK